MHSLTPIPALAGGLLIGTAAALLLLFSGRIAGISGIAAGLVSPARGELAWRALFLLGLVGAPLVLMQLRGSVPTVRSAASDPALIMAGLLVGFGTRLGSGCTSGHGVCGLARRSKRSLVATLTFMASGLLTVFIVRHLLGASR